MQINFLKNIRRTVKVAGFDQLEVGAVFQRQRTVPYQRGIDRNTAARRLTVDLVELYRRYCAGFDQLIQHAARPHGGKLIGVAYEDELAAVRQRVQQMLGQMDVEHGDLVGYHKIGVQHGRFSKLAVSICKQTQRLVNCRGRLSCCLLHAPCRSSGWCTANDGSGRLELLINLQYELLDHGLARARPAGNDADGRTQTGLDRLLLLRSEGYVQLAFDPSDLGVKIGMDMCIALADAFPHPHSDLFLRFGRRITVSLILIQGDFVPVQQLSAARNHHPLCNFPRFK